MNNKKNFNPAVCAAVHEVKSGETLYSIAHSYGIDYQRLMMLNGLTNPNNITTGQEICIPHGRAITEASGGYHISNMQQHSDAPSSGKEQHYAKRSHTIADGDTLYGISKNYNVSLASLMSYNPDIDPYNLQIGSVLNIPSVKQAETDPARDKKNGDVSASAVPIISSHSITSESSQTDGIIHTVSADESITDILTQFNICYHALLHENPGIDFTSDITGVSVCIPYDDIFTRTPENQPYIGKSGDTLMSISEGRNVSQDELLKMNPCCNILNFSTPGTRLRV